jgi:hypothetical protein
MTDREAMKLALFALDIVKIHYTQSRHVNEAIAALKERLADPMREVQKLGQEIEQEPVRLQCVTCGTVYADGVPPQVAQPEQEPLAWVNKERNTITWDKLYPDMDALYTTSPYKEKNT